MAKQETLTLSKWGNSIAIRLPKNVLDDLNLENKDKVVMSVKNGEITLKPEKPKSALEKMFEGYHGTPKDYPFEVVDKGGAVGNELI
ncbi:AbrB/MazE/SpoVT family DNA-binding domain-containing protein [Limosilactobacillus sp.]|uniref:AbrB/MazE/SpoVT family DNA-binding domain-containing protein n=1 Tax=Limosilactobacillus sp. TaxID=2773925 RepID=UPI00345EE740